MSKIYVLDTNVPLSDPNAIYSFGDNIVIIPTTVLQELDTKKKLMDELGRNTRYTINQLDKLKTNGKLHEGVPLPNGGALQIVISPTISEAYDGFGERNNDLSIIATAYELKNKYSKKEVILVSRDVNVRVIAETLGVTAEGYNSDKVVDKKDDTYTGITELTVDSEEIDVFYKEKRLISHEKYPENHFVILKCGKQSALTRYSKGFLYPLYQYNEDDFVWGLKAKNMEQRLALDLLLDENIPLVTLSGKAGTGKTLLALAASLQQVMDKQIYTKIIVSRPVIPMGKDLGFLPGTKEEKLEPWMSPIFDNLEFLFNCKDKDELNKTLSGYEDVIRVEALTYIRGRSIPNQIMIIDEAQNLTRHEVKTILTRIGEGTKVILVGDPEQIDSPYLDAFSNGLTYVIEKMKDLKESGHVTLTKGERSNLAQLAADIL